MVLHNSFTISDAGFADQRLILWDAKYWDAKYEPHADGHRIPEPVNLLLSWFCCGVFRGHAIRSRSFQAAGRSRSLLGSRGDEEDSAKIRRDLPFRGTCRSIQHAVGSHGETGRRADAVRASRKIV
jgi:hypothetical protein